jgi:hypothetical protein
MAKATKPWGGLDVIPQFLGMLVRIILCSPFSRPRYRIEAVAEVELKESVYEDCNANPNFPEGPCTCTTVSNEIPPQCDNLLLLTRR